MNSRNTHTAGTSTSTKSGSAKTPNTPSKGLSSGESRRGTYTPQRPSGVHATELGLKKI